MAPDNHTESLDKKDLTSSPKEAPLVSTYLDYRLFLADFLKYKRSIKIGLRKYSYSDFAAAADLKSPQYLKLVIEKKRNLSDDGIAKFAQGLGLNKKDSQDFCHLVHYNQATAPKDRYHYLQKLSMARAENFKDLKSPHWLKVIVYSICDGVGGAYSLENLQSVFKSRCKTQDLQKCLDEMVEEGSLEVLKTESSTPYYQISKNKNALSNDIPLNIIKKIQSDLLFLGLESLFIDDPKERDLGSFSVALTTKEFEDVKFEMRKFRKSLLRDLLMKREKSPGERIYQVQFQIFPVTEKVTPGTKPKLAKANSSTKSSQI